jgi:5-methylcytosine-specific restriction enzyme A
MGRLQTLRPRVQSAPSRVQTVTSTSWRTGKDSSTARGYGYKWQQERAAFLRQNPWCHRCLEEAGIDERDASKALACCLRQGITPPPANLVDHRVPHHGDQQLFWDRKNWEPMCNRHHSSDKQREESKLYP